MDRVVRGGLSFELEEQAAWSERAGRQIIRLEGEAPSDLYNGELVRCLRRELSEPDLGCGDPVGEAALRDLLARIYSLEKQQAWAAENVVLGPPHELLAQLYATHGSTGHRVLIPEPGLPLYRLAADLQGLEAVPYWLSEGDGWQPEVERVIDRLRRDGSIRVLVVQTPSNPLGTCLAPDAVEALASAAAKRGVVCVIDERYKNLVYAGGPQRAPTVHPESVYLHSFSEEAAAPGLQLGCLVGPEAVVARVASRRPLFGASLPITVQRAVHRYIEEGRAFHPVVRDGLSRRAGELTRIERARGLRYVAPSAGFFAFLNVSRLGVTGDAFAEAFLRESGVLVCPGSAFGVRGRRHVRITLCGDVSDFQEGCQRLVAFSESLRRARPASGPGEAPLRRVPTSSPIR